MFALSQAQVATIALDETTILEIKAISALPFKSSLTTWIVRWWQRVLPKGVLKFRAFVLLIKPVPLLFIFLSSLSSLWLFELASYVTVQNNWQYPTILLNNRRFDGKRVAQTTSAGTHWEAESWYTFWHFEKHRRYTFFYHALWQIATSVWSWKGLPIC